MRLKNAAASWGLLLELVEKSTQAHLLWRGLDDFVFEVAGEDESAVATKLLSKRP